MILQASGGMGSVLDLLADEPGRRTARWTANRTWPAPRGRTWPGCRRPRRQRWACGTATWSSVRGPASSITLPVAVTEMLDDVVWLPAHIDGIAHHRQAGRERSPTGSGSWPPATPARRRKGTLMSASARPHHVRGRYRRPDPPTARCEPLLADDPWWLVLVKALMIFVMLLLLTLFAIWFERKVVGRMQHRPGPNWNGPFGLLQSLADALKLHFKEGIIPARADKFVYHRWRR